MMTPLRLHLLLRLLLRPWRAGVAVVLVAAFAVAMMAGPHHWPEHEGHELAQEHGHCGVAHELAGETPGRDTTPGDHHPSPPAEPCDHPPCKCPCHATLVALAPAAWPAGHTPAPVPGAAHHSANQPLHDGPAVRLDQPPKLLS